MEFQLVEDIVVNFVSTSVFLSGISILLVSCDALSQMPGCGDPMTQKGARYAIENSYVSAGLQGSEKPFVDKLLNLKEYSNQALVRNYVRIWELRSTDDVRLCRAELMKDSFMLVVIARNPKSQSELGYVAYNIGLPDQLILGEGWLND